MDLTELQARKAKLAKTETRETTLNPAQVLAQMKENKLKAEGTNVEKWFHNLKDQLIPSHLFPLSLEAAKALVASYEHTFMGKPDLTRDQQNALDSLAALIESEAEKWSPGLTQKGFFVRLSTRSPKDALIFHPKMFAAIKADCDQLRGEGKLVTENDILRFCYIHFVKKMVVYSGKEAVSLLATSHRIWQDINASIDSMIDTFEMGVFIREWAQIHPSMEFRGFVYGKKLNAISSYNRAVCWPGIPERKAEIERRCRDYWEQIKDKIPSDMENFIVDFAFLEDSDKVTIVEFNDFADFEELF